MKLSRMIVIATAVFLLAGAGARAATEIKDIDPSNWAYKSIRTLVDKGYLALYEDNTFRGDQALSRTVFAAALAKLIDQIQSGDLKLGGADMAQIKKLSDEFRGEIADYESKIGSIEKRVSDIESGKVVIQTDISKTTVEFRDKYDKLAADNAQLRQDLNALNDEMKNQLADVRAALDSERTERKKAQSTMWIGIGLAAIVGVAVK
jgi:type I site-specific restriction-modification system R (restriction) subunit